MATPIAGNDAETKNRTLEAITHTFDMLKRFVAEYYQLKDDYYQLRDERNDFEKRVSQLVDENEALSAEGKRINGERERCLHALSTCARQIDAIGTRSAELAKTVRAQAHNAYPAKTSERNSAPPSRLEQRSQPDVLGFLKGSPEERGSLESRGAWEARKAAPEESEPRTPSPDLSHR